MGIDVGGAFTISGSDGTQSFEIAAGATDLLTIDGTGRTFYPNQVGFIAGRNSDPGWMGLVGAAWSPVNWLNNTTYNKGGGYANNRFTAPFAGAYLFHWTGYHYKPTATTAYYIHCMFWVNGATVPTCYRTKHLWTPQGYSLVGEVVDILQLNANDYVEVQIYAAGAGISVYPFYTMFSGALVG